jgi:NADP-dependent 3-hydroxy acid dehydrogenase YdfG
MGLLYCTHAALPIMAEQQSGHIVNLSSVAGRIASAGSAVYNLTKWGVGAFSEALRQEALHIGVRVTIVEPGFVETELQSHNRNPAVLEQLEKMRERVEPLAPRDIADAIAYAVTRPPHVSINEVLVQPTKQPR